MLWEIQIISEDSAGDLRKNESLLMHLTNGSLTNKILKSALKGTPLVKMGNGNPKIMLTAGIHGNELAPQIAALMVVEKLKEMDLSGSVFIIPFSVPYATMNSSRRFKGFDMNRKASMDGSISNIIIEKAKYLKINSLADFHSTKPNSNPGVESIFCSKKPCPQSYEIAEHISKVVGSKILCHKIAGTLYHGALEDESNILGIPAVTCEVVSHNHKVDSGSHERSYLQMMAYLDYFNILSV
jgi:predicted deacylase